jgi:DNA modification methylase
VATDGKDAQAYAHTEEKLLLRPDIGLQPQFRSKKPPKTYRYDASLDPALSWDSNAERERGEALIAKIERATDLAEARAAAAELKRMSRPFLNWAGKAERQELTVPTLPLFVHECLSTQAILQSLKSHKPDRQQTLALFADEELDVADRLLKAYEHPSPWVNRLVLGDSLIVMNSLLQYEGLGGQVQMIYMDPPYGVRFGSNFQPFVRRRDVKHGDDTDLTREPEMVQAYRDTWELGLHSYLTYLRDRLLVSRELLHPSGSIFVQISDENLHWKTSLEGLRRLGDSGRLIPHGKGLYYKRYFGDFPFTALNSVWEDTQSGGTFAGREPKVYVVQTNSKVIQRCLLMTSDPGDLVLDPTCGSGTTAYVAEQWGRRWITNDTSRRSPFPTTSCAMPRAGRWAGSSTSAARTSAGRRSGGSSRT